MKEVTLLEFVYVRFNDLQLTVVRGSFFLDFVANSARNFFLPTSEQRQAKFCLFLGIFWRSCFSYR